MLNCMKGYSFIRSGGGRGSVALSDLIIKQAKSKDKRYTLSDGRGLILEVHPNGRKYWYNHAEYLAERREMMQAWAE